MSELAQGLQISVLGILITFASLGVLILVMVVLRELFSRETTVTEEPEKSQVELAYYQEELRMRAAAAAVLVASLQKGEHRDANLGALLESPFAMRSTRRS